MPVAIESGILWLIGGFALIVAAAWVLTMFAIRKQTNVLEEMFRGSTLLRIITVFFIITAATVLGLTRTMTAELSAILAGIAGYVLGGAAQDRTGARKGDTSGTAPDALDVGDSTDAAPE